MIIEWLQERFTALERSHPPVRESSRPTPEVPPHPRLKYKVTAEKCCDGRGQSLLS
jgi:hypothetical protein